MEETPSIKNTDYWLKVVDMLQQNWAVIESTGAGVAVYFFDDHGVIFDRLSFEFISDAETALRRNGFSLYSEERFDFIAKARHPCRLRAHDNGPIYSSGRFWHS